MEEVQHLTKEQEAIRLKGLRILARIIVRAHLSSLANGEAGLNGRLCEDHVDESARTMEVEDAA